MFKTLYEIFYILCFYILYFMFLYYNQMSSGSSLTKEELFGFSHVRSARDADPDRFLLFVPFNNGKRQLLEEWTDQELSLIHI